MGNKTDLETKLTTTEQPVAETTPALPEVKFSWMSVYRRWKQNMKEDVDPALIGLKAGVYFWHAGSTWRRDSDDGKMTSKKHGITNLMGILSAGLIGGAYYTAAKVVNTQTHSQWKGYATAAGTIAVAQAASWSYEAFRRAKKTEASRVIVTRVQRAADVQGTGYDLTVKDIVDKLVAVEMRDYRDDVRVDDDRSSRGGYDPRLTEQEAEERKRDLERRRKSAQEAADAERARRFKASREGIQARLLTLTGELVNGLYADNGLGKKYEMTADLAVGPKSRQTDRYGQRSARVDASALSTLVAEVVKAKNGNANIELFGQVSAIYGDADKGPAYKVTPNKAIWKV